MPVKARSTSSRRLCNRPAALRVCAPRPEFARRPDVRLGGSAYGGLTDENVAMTKRLAVLLIVLIILSGCQIFELEQRSMRPGFGWQLCSDGEPIAVIPGRAATRRAIVEPA